jgi:hypothetical protein
LSSLIRAIPQGTARISLSLLEDALQLGFHAAVFGVTRIRKHLSKKDDISNLKQNVVPQV